MDTDRVKVKIYDSQFAHGTTLGSGDLKIQPDLFDWTRGDGATWPNICVVSESYFHKIDQIPEQHKVGLLIEPVAIDASHYKTVRDPAFQAKFDYILTHNQELIDLNPKKFIFYPFSGCWIWPTDQQVYSKTKEVSIVASKKKDTYGHRLRHEVIDKCQSILKGHTYGRGYQAVDYKLITLKDYRFQIVIENEKRSHWFTEKLCDCFLTGTVPIYYGTPTIGDFYDAKGILQFDTVEELQQILTNCHEEQYLSMLSHIHNNFNIAKKYGSLPDNYIFDWLQKTYTL